MTNWWKSFKPHWNALVAAQEVALLAIVEGKKTINPVILTSLEAVETSVIDSQAEADKFRSIAQSGGLNALAEKARTKRKSKTKSKSKR